ncbi:MAG: inositol monophosphatase family protein [Candidatus Nanopelagicales bacterium]
MNELEMARAVAARAGQLLVAIRTEAGDIAPDDKAALKALRDDADRRSNELITADLVLAQGDALLSEEGVDDESRLSAQRVWIVDPLDGTWEYGQGRSDFGVHIALWDMARKEMLLGVVDLPAQGLVRTSGDLDPELPMLPEDRPLRVVASRTRPPADLDAICARLAERVGQAVEVVNVGSVGAKVNEILLGNAEAYLHDTGFYEWDLAAPLAVAKHYGLVCDHWDGSEVDFNLMPPFVKNTFVSHPAIADALRASLAP